MICADFNEQVAALALGMLTPAEVEECFLHLAQPGPHEGCHAALAEAEATVWQLAAAYVPVKPSPESWQNIERRLKPRMSTNRRVATWVAAAAAVAGLYLLTDRTHEQDAERSRLETQLTNVTNERTGLKSKLDECLVQQTTDEKAVALAQQPHTALIAMAPAAAGQQVTRRATVLLNAEHQRAMVMVKDFRPEPGHDYQLWVIPAGGSPISAGLLRPQADGTAVAELDLAITGQALVAAVAISREPTGGSVKPSEVLMVGTVKS